MENLLENRIRFEVKFDTYNQIVEREWRKVKSKIEFLVCTIPL